VDTITNVETDEQALGEAVHGSTGRRLEGWCEFSPGPTWGFNGIQTLALTAEDLCVFQRGIAFTARRNLSQTAVTTVPLKSIRGVVTKRRPALTGRGQVITLRLHTDHGSKTYTTKDATRGQAFEALLRSLIS
jgi:hypothetical protein